MPTMKNRDQPADDATRKRMLKERLAEKEPAGLYSKKSASKPAEVNKGGPSVMGAVKNLKQRKGRLDQAIEDSGG